jgi:hypothetical protein
MKRFKLFSTILVLAILVFGYFHLITNAPVITTKVFKEPHWKLQSQYHNFDIREIGSMDFRCYDAQGNLKWEELDRLNNLADEGEYMFLDVTLRNGSAPSNYYLRLFNDTPVDTDTIGSLTGEPSGNGYTVQTVERSTTGWPTLALDSGDHQAISSTETFSATGAGWGPVIYCVVTTSTDSSGKLVSYVALSQSRTLASGESLQVTYKLKLQ